MLAINASGVISVKFNTSKLFPRAVKPLIAGKAARIAWKMVSACLSALTDKLMWTRPAVDSTRGSTSATEYWSSVRPMAAAIAWACATGAYSGDRDR